MLFGLFNTPASFHDYINKILAKKLNIFIIVYQDNILIYIKEVDYNDVIWYVLNQLRKYFFYANLRKCYFYQKEMQFLGYVVSLQEICIENEQIEPVYNWSKPQLIWDIQIFLGFTNFYRQFIESFDRITAPLISILKTTVSSFSATELRFTNEGSTIEVEVSDGNNNEIGMVNITKTVKSKIVLQPKNPRRDFLYLKLS